jgi:hypothetical protein
MPQATVAEVREAVACYRKVMRELKQRAKEDGVEWQQLVAEAPQEVRESMLYLLQHAQLLYMYDRYHDETNA